MVLDKARPIPVPGDEYSPGFWLFAWKKRANICETSFLAIPDPVSDILISTSLSVVRPHMIIFPLSGVYLKALDNKLKNTFSSNWLSNQHSVGVSDS